MMEILDTWYIPEGETHHITLPSLRDGNEEGRALLVDDRGDLILPCYVEEADHDGLLVLKQFDAAAAVIETMRAAKRYADIEPDEVQWTVKRRVDGSYRVDHEAVDSLEEAM